MWKLLQGTLEKICSITAHALYANVLYNLLQLFSKVKKEIQYLNDYDDIAHKIGSQVLNSIVLSEKDTKTRETLMAILVFSNASYKQAKSVFPWVKKYEFCTKPF